MKNFLCTLCALLPLMATVMAEEEAKTASVTLKVEMSDDSMKVLEGVKSLNRRERDLLEKMAAEDEARDVEPVRPKREAPANPLLALLKPKTAQTQPSKDVIRARIQRRRKRLQKIRKARRANRVRRNKHRRAVAKARRQAKARLRARLIRQIQKARIQRSKQRANEAKLADQLSRE
ncbi:unnamed protein product [Cylicocyclus nassatus]|uniref:BZIP domain-containing protein n=1 Tax=Cylicocyclus nassatus TaxID=53992 RepID=A0AA36H8Z9_CYLNA|nr:unnamed protein product [Cylicocyclus nassatus]